MKARGLFSKPSQMIWTAFCTWEERFSPQFKNNACTISFHMHIRVFTDESEIAVPNCKIKSTSPLVKIMIDCSRIKIDPVTPSDQRSSSSHNFHGGRLGAIRSGSDTRVRSLVVTYASAGARIGRRLNCGRSGRLRLLPMDGRCDRMRSCCDRFEYRLPGPRRLLFLAPFAFCSTPVPPSSSPIV